MNFKIEINYINITNYPFMEDHFEKRAREGWLISKIFQEYIFIYKKINPEDLEFSITPYEMESFFTKKTKADLQEFQTVCQYVGWNYATKTSDLHIYFKEKSDDAMPLETDEEELFTSLESIGKKLEKRYYLLTIYGVFLSWFILRRFFKDTQALKDGLQLLLAISLPIMLIFGIVHIIDLNRFLNRNRKNIESGLTLVFDNSKKNIYRILFIFISLIFTLFIFHLLYSGFILKNKIILLASLPVLIGVSIGTLYRFIVKPKKIELSLKVIIFVFVIIIAVVISNITGLHFLDSLSDRSVNLADIENYKVISTEDINKKESSNSFYKNASILIPQSYDYYSYSKMDAYIKTEYSKALNEPIAQILIKRYLKEAKETFIFWTENPISHSISSGDYETRLGVYGIGEEDFDNIKDKDRITARKELQEIGLSSSIIKADEKAWNVDEAYYLDYKRSKIVLRKNKEVVYLNLDEMNFSNEIIQIIKTKLGF